MDSKVPEKSTPKGPMAPQPYEPPAITWEQEFVAMAAGSVNPRRR